MPVASNRSQARGGVEPGDEQHQLAGDHRGRAGDDGRPGPPNLRKRRIMASAGIGLALLGFLAIFFTMQWINSFI